MRFIPSATRSRCTDAKVAYGLMAAARSGGRAVSGGIFLLRSVFNPKTLPLPAIRLKSIRQRKQAQKIHPNAELEPVARHGEKPQILQFGSAVEELSGIMGLISTYRKSGYKSLGIICKTEQQARKMADMLKSYANDISFLSSQSSAFVQGIVITSAHMAKGLEFDEVIIPQTDERNYRSEIDKSMLYVAVTRAMHRLTLTFHEARPATH